MVGAERASVVFIPSSLWQEPLFDVVSHSLSADPAKDWSGDDESGVSDATRSGDEAGVIDATRALCKSEASVSHRFRLVVSSTIALTLDASMIDATNLIPSIV